MWRLQFYKYMVEHVLEPFDVSDNLKVQMKLPKEGANKCWNTLEYQLNSVTWHMRSGALTLQRGVTGTARIANTSPVVECRAVPACCTVLLIRLYLDNIWRKCNRTASCVFVKELALLWSGWQFLEIISSFFSLLSKSGFSFCCLGVPGGARMLHGLTHSTISWQHMEKM